MKLVNQLRNAVRNAVGNVNSKKYWDSKLDRLQSWDKRNQIYTDLVELFPKGVKSVLDVGCSAGDGCIALKAQLPDVRVEGCDFSEVGIDLAKKKSEQVEFFCLDIVKDELPREYDCILLISVIEHLKEYHGVLRKCLDHCDRLIVSVPYRERISILGFKPSEHLHSFREDTLDQYVPLKVVVQGKRITYVLPGRVHRG